MNSLLNLVVPPASLVMLAFAWPALCFLNACERMYNTTFNGETMDDKVVVITGASSGIGEASAQFLFFLFYNYTFLCLPLLLFLLCWEFGTVYR